MLHRPPFVQPAFVQLASVQLPTPADGSVGVEGQWVENGGHFGHEELIAQITSDDPNIPPNILVEAQPGSGKSHLFHYIAWLWAERKALESITVLLLIKGRNLRDKGENIEDEIKRIIEDECIDKYKEWRKKKRIVILFDAFDEAAANVNYMRFRRTTDHNITLVVSARRHKTKDLIPGQIDAHDWRVIRCLGLQNLEVERMFETLPDPSKTAKIRAALEKNNLHQSPLFILFAQEIFLNTAFDENTILNQYTLMSRFYDYHLKRYKGEAFKGANRLQEFENALGCFAIDSGAFENIYTPKLKDVTEDARQKLKNALTNLKVQQKIDDKMMDSWKETASDVGLLFDEYCSRNGQESRYSFVHKIIAEFFIAKLLHNSKLGKYANTLSGDSWSLIEYYLLMSDIDEKKQDEGGENASIQATTSGHNTSGEMRQKALLKENSHALINNINGNHSTMLAILVEQDVLSSSDLTRWHNIAFLSGPMASNLELLQLIGNGDTRAFGIFYNALVLSSNRLAASILRPGLDAADIKLDDGYELYVVK